MEQPKEYQHDIVAELLLQAKVTVRDYFAAKYIAAWTVALAARCNQPGYNDLDCCAESVRLGELQADMHLAMLKEREK